MRASRRRALGLLAEHRGAYAAGALCLLRAELVWLPKGRKDYASFLERMTVQEQRFDAAKVKYRKTDP